MNKKSGGLFFNKNFDKARHTLCNYKKDYRINILKKILLQTKCTEYENILTNRVIDGNIKES